MLKFLKVAGESLLPDYKNGDYVLIANVPVLFRSIKPGDVIAFRHSVYGILIKRVDIISEAEGYYVSGTHENSLDSRRIGPVQASNILGKVIWHIPR